jgi:hypothetical protein
LVVKKTMQSELRKHMKPQDKKQQSTTTYSKSTDTNAPLKAPPPKTSSGKTSAAGTQVKAAGKPQGHGAPLGEKTPAKWSRSGKMRPMILLWALGVPVPLIILFLLIRGCA